MPRWMACTAWVHLVLIGRNCSGAGATKLGQHTREVELAQQHTHPEP